MDTEPLEHGIYTKRTLIVFFLIALAVTTSLTVWLAPPDWSWFRIGAGGFIGASLCYLMVFVNHMIAPPKPT